MRAGLAARVTPCALFEVNGVLAVWRHGDRFNGTALSAEGATGAVVENSILDKLGAFAGWTVALQVGFVFFPEISERG